MNKDISQSIIDLENSLTSIFGIDRAKNIMIGMFSKEFLSKDINDKEERNKILSILSQICNNKQAQSVLNKPTITNIEKSYKYKGDIVRGTDSTGNPYTYRGYQNKPITGDIEKVGDYTIKRYERFKYGDKIIAKVTFNSNDPNLLGLVNYYPMDRNVVRNLFPTTYNTVYKILDQIEHKE